MVRYHINVKYGDDNNTKKFYFVHEKYDTISQEDSDIAFDKAVQELNRVYKNYGRFATTVGIARLFKQFGFIESTP